MSRPLRALDRAWRVFFTGSAFLLFFSSGALLSYAVLPWRALLPCARRARWSRQVVSWAWGIFHRYLTVMHLLRYDPRSVTLRLPRGPFVLVANHPTLVDVTALAAVIPDLAIVAKGTMFHNRLVGRLLRACDHIEAGDGSPFAGAAVVEQALRHLRAGTPVLIFPEGTRSPADAPGLGPMRLGAFQIAALAGVPVLPVFIACTPRMLMRGHPWYAIPERTAEFTVSQLPVIDPSSAPPSALAQALRDAYLGRLARGGAGPR